MTARHWDIKLIYRMVSVILAAALLSMIFLNAGSRTSQYCILKESGLKIEVCRIRGKQGGPAVYIVAGIHGDETAGLMAADKFKKKRLPAGTLYIVSPANPFGAEQAKRRTEEERDLNRNFPGNPDGCDAERIAAAIYEDIKEKKPTLLLDLHEAVQEGEGEDALGNSLICQSIEETGDLILELLAESESGRFSGKQLTLYGSAPPGSINRVVTEELGIPVITVETFREEVLEQRIENQLEIAGWILKYYGLQ